MDLSEIFQEKFNRSPQLLVRAPGRVNLIGEHTDYNEGFVLPVAIDRAVYLAARKNDSQSVSVYSADYGEFDRFSLAAIDRNQGERWSNYLRGVVKVMQEAGHSLGGFDAVVQGDVPQGAGLSSSAAFEVAVAVAVDALNGLGLERRELALLAQRAENQFVGVQCGIMDQFISLFASADAALLIDCRSLAFSLVPLPLAAHQAVLVICDSGVRRGLVDSAYNERRQQCRDGVTLLSSLLKRELKSLRDLSLQEWLEHEHALPEPLANRCRHVVSENERVIKAQEALAQGDLAQFGALMNESHRSLRDDFAVSCPELDRLVAMTQEHSGTIGARMTGAGFGGCIIAVMNEQSLDDYRRKVVPAYERDTERQARIYACKASQGASLEYCEPLN